MITDAQFLEQDAQILDIFKEEAIDENSIFSQADQVSVSEIESEDGFVLDQLAFYSWFQSSNQFSIQRSINLILKEKTECQ